MKLPVQVPDAAPTRGRSRAGAARWRRLAPVLLAGVALVLGGAPPAAADGGGPARLRAFLTEVKTLRADFAQVLYDESRAVVEEGEGTLYLSRPGRFRWDYRAPYVQTIVADGSRVWVHDPDLAQVTVRALDDAVRGTPAVLLSSERPLEESFELRDLGPGQGLAWVGLVPRSAESSFTEIRIAFDAATLRRMELVDGFGQITVISLEPVEVNPPLDPALFVFQAPAGTDVVGDPTAR